MTETESVHLATALLGLEWSRPLGLLGLLLPVLLLLLLRRPRPPRSLATGTMELWRDVEREERAAPPRSRRGLVRRRLSWRVWALCAALTLGALALAGPRRARAPSRERWVAVVDRSPSMYLPAAPGAAGTRYEAAVEIAVERLGELGAGEEIRWWTPGESPAAGARPPLRWSSPPPGMRPAPAWSRWDAPGHLWVTDRAPGDSSGGAGVAASGGAAVPGPIGQRAGRWILWDGTALVEGGPAAPCALELDGAIPRRLAELAGIWSEERGFSGEAGDAATGGVRLLATAGAGVAGARAARDGWEIEGTAAAGGAPLEDREGGLETWLRSGEGVPLVTWGPGRVHVALRGIDRLAGDPAAFAVSWARLLDGAALPPPGCLPLEERQPAGEARWVAPARPVAEAASTAPGRVPLEAWLALSAGVLAALSWLGSAGRRAGPSRI